MRPVSLGQHETRAMGKPANWNEEKQGPCDVLSIRDQKDGDGNPVMMSRWRLEAAELKALNNGWEIELYVYGTALPPVSLAVVAPMPGVSEEAQVHG